VDIGGRSLLASAGDDRTVRIWNPATGACELVIPIHHQALARAWTQDHLMVGLSAGLIALALWPAGEVSGRSRDGAAEEYAAGRDVDGVPSSDLP